MKTSADGPAPKRRPSGSSGTSQPSEIRAERHARHFRKLWDKMRTIYPRYETTPEMIGFYYELLKEFPERTLEAAVNQCLKEIPIFPPPADIYKRALRQLPPAKKKKLDGAPFDPKVKELLTSLAGSFEKPAAAPMTPDEEQARREELKRQQEEILRKEKGDGKDKSEENS